MGLTFKSSFSLLCCPASKFLLGIIGILYNSEQYVFWPQGGRHSAHIGGFFSLSKPWMRFSKWPGTQWILSECVLADCVFMLCFGFTPAQTQPNPDALVSLTALKLHFCTTHSDGEEVKLKRAWSLPVRTWLLPLKHQVILVISSVVPPLTLKQQVFWIRRVSYKDGLEN